jgi:hypothetical protein
MITVSVMFNRTRTDVERLTRILLLVVSFR